MNTGRSKELFARAQKYMPGGVNSPVRAFKSVGLTPLFIERGQGSKIYDADANEYIDYVCSWGPLILGHSHPQVIEAICQAASQGTSFGACCEKEIELTELICTAFPSIDKVRLVNSGTEATMSAARLARAYTGKNKIVKFEGCYHGHGDSFLIKAGSGLLTFNQPSSPGIPESFAQHTLVCQYNDRESVGKCFSRYGTDIAAVIVEPIAANMGLVNPHPGFLEYLREITSSYNSLLIFDEVITGFRIAYGGLQNTLGIIPDLTTLGKIIGGGLPMGAYGGKKEIMDRVAPQGDVYQAGTLSGNPIAVSAGICTLKLLQKTDCYQQLDLMAKELTTQLQEVFTSHELEVCLNRAGSLFSVFFARGPVDNFAAVSSSNTNLYSSFFRELLLEGVYFPPSQFEVCFISSAHNRTDIDKTVQAVDKALTGMERLICRRS